MDLYSLLGLTRAASTEEVERAYRRLARRYHPGINPGDRVAEEMYRQIQHAYDVLADLERRREYDRGRARGPVKVETAVSFEGFDFSAPAEGPLAATFSELFAGVFQDAAREATTPSRGIDIEGTLALSFIDAVRGGQFPLSVLRQERCSSCGGDGRVPRPAVACPACGGQGSRRWARGHMVFTTPCDGCGSTGRLSAQTCRPCGGVGLQVRSEVVTIGVPPGIDRGARVCVPGRGHAGARGGPNGDLYVTVEVGEHPYFRRIGRDLHLTVPLAIHEAALGARIEVPTLDGPVRLRIPPGTSSGRRLRVTGRGVPSVNGTEAGDLIVETQIVLPAIRDERSRELLKEFGRLNDGDVRREMFETGR
ncbi:MAG TPA: J domain-containing protein [Vicinamibacterales bacterium]|nr:J domain-containing protein [Vicinamibacterales bacterium]